MRVVVEEYGPGAVIFPELVFEGCHETDFPSIAEIAVSDLKLDLLLKRGGLIRLPFTAQFVLPLYLRPAGLTHSVEGRCRRKSGRDKTLL